MVVVVVTAVVIVVCVIRSNLINFMNQHLTLT